MNMFMRRIWFIIVALATLSGVGTTNAMAQGGFRWGLMGGAHFSKWSTKSADYRSQLFTAMQVGPMVEYELPILPIAIEAGLLYSQRGASLEMASEEALSLKSHLIEVPVQLKAYVLSVPAARFFVIAGPSLHFALNSSIGDIRLTEVRDIKANRVGVNLHAGIGVELLRYLQLSASFGAAMVDGYRFEGIYQSLNDYVNTKDKGVTVTARLLF